MWRFECVTDIDVAGLDEPEIADRFRERRCRLRVDHAGEVPKIMAIRVLRTFGLYEPQEQIDWESFEGRPRRVADRRPPDVPRAVPTLGVDRARWCSGAEVAGLVAPRRRRSRSSWPSPRRSGTGTNGSASSAEPGLLILAAVAVAWPPGAERSLHCFGSRPESARPTCLRAPTPILRPNAAQPNVVIIGAGPAGLTAAYELVTSDGVDRHRARADTIVGGISRTVERDGWRFDIGGHRFFTKVQPRSRRSGTRSCPTRTS